VGFERIFVKIEKGKTLALAVLALANVQHHFFAVIIQHEINNLQGQVFLAFKMPVKTPFG
jgi:hypothetical protein